MNEKLKTTNVGQIGFVCPRDGKDTLYNFCRDDCPTRCYSLPLLTTLMSDRIVKPNSYSVSELLNPPQIVWLQRNCSYFLPPEDNVWMTFGTGWHKTVESSKRYLPPKEYIFELPRETSTVAGIKIRGRADLWVPEVRELWDYKTVKSYFIRQIRQGWEGTRYHWQLNLYRYFWYPSTKKMWIEALVKDWTESIARKYNINIVERLEVPFIPDPELSELVGSQLAMFVKNQDDPSTIPECTDEDTWGGRRCRLYCGVRSVCNQWKKACHK